MGISFGTVTGSKFYTDSLVIPLKRLSDGVRRISENDFSGEDLQVEYEDELGKLVEAFNQMKKATAQHVRTLEENYALTEELHREELQRMEAEKNLDRTRLDLLQSQMDPHFLFNTLNTISGMAELEEAETTDRMIRSLASIFRYNLQTTAQFVALSREMKVVRDYMYLQQMRFGGRVGYEEEIDPACDPDKEAGAEVIELSAGEIDRLRELVLPLYETYCGDYMDLIARIRATGTTPDS